MERTVCNRNCWVLGAIAGVVVLLFTAGIGELGLLGGLFLGLVTCWLLGSLLVWLVCEGQQEAWTARAQGHATMPLAAPLEAAAAPVPVPVPAPSAAAGNRMPIVAGALPGVKAEPSKAVEVAAPKAEAAAPTKAAGKTRAKPVADDLRRIKGVGPKLAERLRKSGVTRFEQIAAWDAKTIAEQGKRLGRHGGRVEADDWVGQARILAAGGETEHSRAVDRGEAT